MSNVYMFLKLQNVLVISIFVLVLSSCGYHLAGSGEFSSSLENTSVQAAASSRELVRYIEKYLKSNDINIVEVNEASAIINILNEQTDRIVLSLDNDGKVREFELILNVAYDVKRADDSYMLNEQKISLNRDFVFNKTNLLGSDEEQQEMFSEMRDDAAKVIVYRLQQISE